MANTDDEHLAAINNSDSEEAEFADLSPAFIELVKQVEDYVPTVPDAITASFLNRNGFETVDPRIVRIISVAAQKFISDIANDALQHCKTRTSNNQHSSSHGANKDKKPNKDRKYSLAVEDISPALGDHGITVRKPHYFV
ncbi:transcription initiation factor TFIID subunit 10-like [Teleopsis dalmanni]|uniref:transcription initiation factor TFIID subunit 10-like n=1 Tax=Teleopsis dalmanni TaxID=139649 RepID=UPI000D32CABB|nr:transcription initiation factor TFIID subunit 10-like [Teleopsis dalmanni]